MHITSYDIHPQPVRQYAGVYYVLPYTDSKDLIIGIKSLSVPDIHTAGMLLYQYIVNHIINSFPTQKILLVHCPSSTYATGLRPKDQLAELLTYIKRIHHTDVHLDVFLHTIRIKRTYRTAQHDKNKYHRINDSRDKFECGASIPLSLLNRYTCICIIDDVVTTGASLHAVKEIYRERLSYTGHIILLALAH